MELRYHVVRDAHGYRKSHHNACRVRRHGSPSSQTPFWAENHSDMYYRVLQDELTFPEDRTMDQDTKSLIRGVRHSMPLGSYRWRSDTLLQLLQRNPALRMKEPRIKKHPYFSMMYVFYPRISVSALTLGSFCRDWSHVYFKRYIREYPLTTNPYMTLIIPLQPPIFLPSIHRMLPIPRTSTIPSWVWNP